MRLAAATARIERLYVHHMRDWIFGGPTAMAKATNREAIPCGSRP
ncbi:hypothetical protein SAMN05660748_3938 [Blastococcus aggregatus]|uniref:Uncharacterized protein n=1 Tax=Blastococcus aggregatus TaxID=38502 RepID=A0A285VD50_9ACTN|nr:hypothetical protein [Blastococcus aggregatus]SOC52055.1 hypothetical protein SAMN05660748_3938 [Blastococcus aggregatus]